MNIFGLCKCIQKQHQLHPKLRLKASSPPHSGVACCARHFRLFGIIHATTTLLFQHQYYHAASDNTLYNLDKQHVVKEVYPISYSALFLHYAALPNSPPLAPPNSLRPAIVPCRAPRSQCHRHAPPTQAQAPRDAEQAPPSNLPGRKPSRRRRANPPPPPAPNPPRQQAPPNPRAAVPANRRRRSCRLWTPTLIPTPTNPPPPPPPPPPCPPPTRRPSPAEHRTLPPAQHARQPPTPNALLPRPPTPTTTTTTTGAPKGPAYRTNC